MGASSGIDRLRWENVADAAERWLTERRYCDKKHDMTTKAQTTMTETLREAIAESGLPMMTIAAETGLERTSLLRFARGDQSLRLDKADRLAEYFGFVLVRRDDLGESKHGR